MCVWFWLVIVGEVVVVDVVFGLLVILFCVGE